MKKYLFFIYFLVAGFSADASPSTINEKLLKSLQQSYPHAFQVNWLESAETYVVYFEQDGIRATNFYKKDGSFIRSTRYYQEANLPYYLIAVIKERFPEKKIYCVTEISTPNEISYYIKIEDAKTWRTLQADSDGNITVIEKFNKAS